MQTASGWHISIEPAQQLLLLPVQLLGSFPHFHKRQWICRSGREPECNPALWNELPAGFGVALGKKGRNSNAALAFQKILSPGSCPQTHAALLCQMVAKTDWLEDSQAMPGYHSKRSHLCQAGRLLRSELFPHLSVSLNSERWVRLAWQRAFSLAENVLSAFHSFLKVYGKDLVLLRQGNTAGAGKGHGREDAHSENQKNIKWTLKEAVGEWS